MLRCEPAATATTGTVGNLPPYTYDSATDRPVSWVKERKTFNYRIQRQRPIGNFDRILEKDYSDLTQLEYTTIKAKDIKS